jgi:hypothetical protein
MERLCGRPGCSDRASVAYGMRAEDLVFWIDLLPDPIDHDAPVLCRRHADSMVVPRGWTLDDLRDPELHLFRPPLPAPSPRSRVSRPVRIAPSGEQLQLGADIAAPDPSDVQLDVAVEVAADAAFDGDRVADLDDTVDAGPWTPSFDEADDLDGLLSAQSPLLSRAFRTADRPAE